MANLSITNRIRTFAEIICNTKDRGNLVFGDYSDFCLAYINFQYTEITTKIVNHRFKKYE